MDSDVELERQIAENHQQDPVFTELAGDPGSTGEVNIDMLTRSNNEAGKKFIQAARIMYDHAGRLSTDDVGVGTAMFDMEPKAITDQEVAEWAISTYGWFNANLGSAVFNWFRFRQAPAKVVRAFIEGMEIYDNASTFDSSPETAAATVGRQIAGFATDPLNWLGIGVMAKLGTIGVPKYVIKNQFKNIMTRYNANTAKGRLALAAGEGAVEGAIDVGSRQGMQADLTGEPVGENIAAGAGKGAVLGAGMASALSGATTAISKGINRVTE